MRRLLKILVVVQFILAVMALVAGAMLFQQRELLKGRTQKLERALIALATMIESQDPTATEIAGLKARDVDRVVAEMLEAPQCSSFWSDYRPELEAVDLPTIDLSNRLGQLACFYRLDPITLKPMRDPLTGQKLTSGRGTMQELLDEVVTRSETQLNRLNETRLQLRTVREELNDTVGELNTRKSDLRGALVTITDRDRAIAGLEDDVRMRDREIRAKAGHIAELNGTIADQSDEIQKRDDRIVTLSDDVEFLEFEVARLKSRPPPGLQPTPTEPPFERGTVGSIAAVSTNWNFVVVNVNDRFVEDYRDIADRWQETPQPHLLVVRNGDRYGDFVTKLKLCWINPSEGVGVANIQRGWTQKGVRAGDRVLF